MLIIIAFHVDAYACIQMVKVENVVRSLIFFLHPYPAFVRTVN